MSELDDLIAEQARDMRYSHRVLSGSPTVSLPHWEKLGTDRIKKYMPSRVGCDRHGIEFWVRSRGGYTYCKSCNLARGAAWRERMKALAASSR